MMQHMQPQQQQQPMPQPQQQVHRKLTVFKTADSIDWGVWRANFEMSAIVNGWNDLTARRMLTIGLEDLAKRMVMDIDPDPVVAPGDPPFTLHSLLDQYEMRFTPEAASDTAHQAFTCASQQSEEAMNPWHARVRELYQRANPQMTVDNRALIQQFTLGIYDEEIRKNTYRSRPQTYTAALISATNESAAKQLLMAAKNRPHMKQIQALEANSISTMENKNKGRGEQKAACYHCGKMGHFKRDCYAWQRVKDAEASGKGGGQKGPSGGAQGTAQGAGAWGTWKTGRRNYSDQRRVSAIQEAADNAGEAFTYEDEAAEN